MSLLRMDRISRVFKISTTKDLFKSLVYALVLALIFRSFIFEFYKIPSGSMVPTLRAGDYIFVSKYNYGYSKYSFSPFAIPLFEGRIFFHPPERGDIIIFKLPTDTSITYIKRLIGLPGDEIQVIEGQLYINGQAVPRMLLGTFTKAEEGKGIVTYHSYEETLPNGVRYETLNIIDHKTSSFVDNTPVYKVPENHYFFMGDNRNHSLDSRFLDKVGYVHEENLTGRAAFLMMTADFSPLQFMKNGDSGRAFTKFQYAN